MAFNFNWTPLTADPSFYERAKELLTGALNKYPKPPIIVNDILVTELNLGSVPPDLEILEVGDIAEDRFRGIFKMCYSGDAYMTLKTRVQVSLIWGEIDRNSADIDKANPLNTYLSTRPSFASPEPLAAAAGLTIPLKITLSNIKLSAFIIVVFSKQKGLTLVFRNDPLESLKVSSTFDSIPFVRDYLQRTIEGQLRTLLMDEAPAIIHRLSLRLWAPEYRSREKEGFEGMDDATTNPLADTTEEVIDLNGDIIDNSQLGSFALDAEAQSIFSHKNLIRLATLSDSQRTLSLFTPTMQDVVYRAWSGPSERPNPFSPGLSRTNSMLTNPLVYNDTISDDGIFSTRPSLQRYGSSFTGSIVNPKTGKPRKRKHRIVNLRKSKLTDDGESEASGTMSSTTSEAGFSAPVQEEREVELITPPRSPQIQRNSTHDSPVRLPEVTPRQSKGALEITDSSPIPDYEATPRQSVIRERPKPKTNRYFQSFTIPEEGSGARASNGRNTPASPFLTAPFPYIESHPGGILEQAWMLKMAGEIARRVQEQKMEQLSKHNEAEGSQAGFWANMSEGPPAYAD